MRIQIEIVRDTEEDEFRKEDQTLRYLPDSVYGAPGKNFSDKVEEREIH